MTTNVEHFGKDLQGQPFRGMVFDGAHFTNARLGFRPVALIPSPGFVAARATWTVGINDRRVL